MSGPFRALYELNLRPRPLPVDDGYFGPKSVAWVIHAAPSSFIGGMRALLMHSLHPLVMAGADQHIEWVSTADAQEVVQRTEPGCGLATRLKLATLSAFVDEEML